MKTFVLSVTVPLTESVMGLSDEQLVVEDAGFESGPMSGLSIDIFYQTDSSVIDLYIETDDDSITEDALALIDDEIYVDRVRILCDLVRAQTSSSLIKKLIARCDFESAEVSAPEEVTDND